MDVKDFLQKGRDLRAEIEQLKYAKSELEDMAGIRAVDYKKEKVHQTKSNIAENAYINVIEYSRLIEVRLSELHVYRVEMLKLINRIGNTTLRALLIARYINCKTWEQVAEDLHYSDVWVRTSLHGKALDEVRSFYSDAQ